MTSTSGAVTGTYTYDANGNMLTGNGRTVAYNAFNKPASITSGGATSSYTYDEGHARIRKVTSTATTTYVGRLYEETRFTNGTLEKRHHIHAGGRLVAIFVDRGATNETQYVYLNHLGSIHVLTGQSGITRFSYDAFGKRRNVDGTDLVAWPSTTPGTRGYTGHEMDDDARCINMNAREYDPVLGRFLQADPIVARPGSTQGLNRYSYTDNNPMSRVDLTGNDWFSDTWGTFWSNGGREFIAVAVAVYMPGALQAYGYSAGVAAMAAGATSGYVLTGSVEGAMYGAITAGVFYGVGTAFEQSGLMERALAQGVAGGAMSEMQGGEFRSGMMSAGFAELFGGSATVKNMGPVQQGIARVLIGGSASVIAGGEFRDGAKSAAFAYLFSRLAASEEQSLDVAIDPAPDENMQLAMNVGPGSGCMSELCPGGGGPSQLGGGSGGVGGGATLGASGGQRTFSNVDRAKALESSKDAQGVPRCEYCGTELAPKAGKPNSYEADHRTPYSRGGSSTSDNLAPSCRTCNRSKGARTPEEWQHE